MSSSANEHFGQYVAILALALLCGVLPEVQAVLLDISCQFSRHVQKHHPEWTGRLGFYIGWLHAKAGHNLECQLGFSAMLVAGLGRCIGEWIEQLWVGVPGCQVA